MGQSPLQDKSKAFAVKIVRFYKDIMIPRKEFTLGDQILRSGTSIGANTRESKNAQSKPDFIHKLSIALKEADETQFWLELFVETSIITYQEFTMMNEPLKEVIALLTASIKTAGGKQ